MTGQVVVPPPLISRQELALEILNRSNIRFIQLDSITQAQIDGRLLPLHNMQDTANGEMARTRNRPYVREPYVNLSEYLLQAILYLNDEFGTISITAIAGLNHSGGASDEHVRGMAIDMLRVSGDALGFLEGLGFITQRTVSGKDWGGDVPSPYAPRDYSTFLSNGLHISIFGRSNEARSYADFVGTCFCYYPGRISEYCSCTKSNSRRSWRSH